jgi:hypothetical protein
VRITRLKERRERPRESRRRGETESAPTGAAAPVQGTDDIAASKDASPTTGTPRS